MPKPDPSVVEEKKQRIAEASWLLLDRAPGRRLKLVPLNKGLFYLDLCALRDLGYTFTKATYLALPFGPVVADYPKRLVRTLEDRGIARSEQGPAEELAKPMVLLAAPQLAYADEYVREKAAEIFESVGKMSSGRASDFSHKNPGWKLAYKAGLGSGKKAMPINMAIAMQQIVDSDPWLVQPLGMRAERAIRQAEDDPAVPW